MLPKIVVKKMKTGEKLAEYFDCVTVFFSTVVEFQVIEMETQQHCGLQVLQCCQVSNSIVAGHPCLLLPPRGGGLPQQPLQDHGPAAGQVRRLQGRVHLGHVPRRVRGVGAYA